MFLTSDYRTSEGPPMLDSQTRGERSVIALEADRSNG